MKVALFGHLLRHGFPRWCRFLRGGCPREGTFCEGDALGMALFVPWGPQEGQILRQGCPRQGTFFFEEVAPGKALFVSLGPQ